MVTPLLSTDALDAATFNARFDEVQAALDDLADGTTATTPNVTDFTSAQHDHTDAAGGGKLTLSAIDSTGGTSGQVATSDGAGSWSWTSLVQVPSGAVIPFAGSSVSSGWLLCAGQAVSRTTYATLYSVIGTTFGVGDGSTTFNLPDLRGRVLIGLDNMNGSSANVVTGSWADSVGGTGGAETHTLITNEMPAHTHTTGVATASYGGGANTAQAGGSGGVTGSTGGGAAHNNMQPSMALNWIIKT